MLIQTLVYIIIGFITLMVCGFVWVFYWMNKNNIIIENSYYSFGAVVSDSIRCRKVKIEATEKNLRKLITFGYSVIELQSDIFIYRAFNDFFGLRVMPFKYSEHNEYMLHNEGMPFVGPKFKLFLWEKTPVTIPYEVDTCIIKDTMISFLNVSKKELWTRTKPVMDAATIAKEILLPMGLILLGICVLIFFPKMYAAVSLQSSEGLKAAAGQLSGFVTNLIPVG